MSQSPSKRRLLRSYTKLSSIDVIHCLVCKEEHRNIKSLNQHYNQTHTKKQMIQGILKIANKSNQQEVIENENIVEDDSSNSTGENTSCSPARSTKGRNSIGHNYNFRTPASAVILRQRNSLTRNTSPSVSPCNSTTSNSDSPSPYFTPDHSLRRRGRRKQLMHSLLSDIDDESSESPEVSLIKLPPCSEIKDGIRKIKEEAREDLSISKLDSDTDSCSDMAMPSVYCSFCSNGYKAIEHLEQHILECPKKETVVEEKHTDDDESMLPNYPRELEKVFVCYFCEEEFNLKLNLEKHLSDHLGEKILTDIMELENDFDLRPESNFVHQYFTYFAAGYNFGLSSKGDCTHSELQLQFYEHLLKDSKCIEGLDKKEINY